MSSPSPPRTPSSSLSAASAPKRRRLSPSSIRDVDLSANAANMSPRVYPPPPTGHELMSLFPPPPPPFLESTSRYFQRQERAFFAQKGKEIIRVRIELDLDHHQDAMDVVREHAEGKGRERHVHLPRPSARESTAAPRYHHPSPPAYLSSDFPPPRAPFVQELAVIPVQSHQQPPPPIQVHVPPERPSSHDDPDESWRRPIPHNERRRAGKHTKRVIVK